MAKWTGKRANVVFSKPDEPSFLKQFKEKVGYKDDSGISDKFEVMPKASEEDLEDGDDELPQVVQLKPGDLTKEEFETEVGNEDAAEKPQDSAGEAERPLDGKILFRKPEKRTPDSGFERTAKTAKRAKAEEGRRGDQRAEKRPKEKKMADRKLLSFDDEEEEETS